MPEDETVEEQKQPDQLLDLYREVRDQNVEIIALLKTIRDKKPEPTGNVGARRRADLFRIGRKD